MPYLKDDNSVPAIVWRGRTNNGNFDLNAMKGTNEIQGSFRTNPSTNYMQPTEVGLRVGVPDNQTLDVAYLQPQQLNPYPNAKSPFFHKMVQHKGKLKRSIEDIVPSSYGWVNEMAGSNGEINKLASIGGQVLAIALDIDELPARMQAEYIRTNSNNPLSQSFAIQAAKQQDQDPLKGPLTDIMRYDVKADFEDQSIAKRKMASGFIQENLLGEEKYKKYKSQIETSRDIFSQDIKDFKDLFLKQVGNMGEQGKSVQETLEVISNKIDRFGYPGERGGGGGGGGGGGNNMGGMGGGKKKSRQIKMENPMTGVAEVKRTQMMGVAEAKVHIDPLQNSQRNKIKWWW